MAERRLRQSPLPAWSIEEPDGHIHETEKAGKSSGAQA
jgi:hypothetical protein